MLCSECRLSGGLQLWQLRVAPAGKSVTRESCLVLVRVKIFRSLRFQPFGRSAPLRQAVAGTFDGGMVGTQDARLIVEQLRQCGRGHGWVACYAAPVGQVVPGFDCVWMVWTQNPHPVGE
jgi:hypothetical protein